MAEKPFFQFAQQGNGAAFACERDYELAEAINRLHDLFFSQVSLPETKITHGEERVITVRVPKQLHTSLKKQAHGLNISLNQLCIGRLTAATTASVPHKTLNVD